MEFDRMLTYCAALEAHNERPWFHANHKWYEEARADFIELTERLKYRVAESASPALAERLLSVQAKDLLFRVPRDMRVWKNAPPYNPTWRAYIAGDRHAIWPVGYFYMVAPGGRTHFGTGAWCQDSAWLRHIRDYISEHFEQFEDALSASGCALWEDPGAKLKNVPRGFDPADPAAEYLKYKEWFVADSFPDAELRDFDGFVDRCGEAVERMEPLRRFFDAAFAQKPRNPWDPSDWE